MNRAGSRAIRTGATRVVQLLRNLAGSGCIEPESSVTIENLTRHTVLARSVEVADRGGKRRKGLLGRDGLAPEEGLWIIPCESVHTFGMRFAIDLVYIDRRKRVRKVRNSVPPWRLSACFSAHSVVELSAGAILAAQTQRGDQLAFTGAVAGSLSGAGV